MKRAALLPLILLASYCSTGTGGTQSTTTQPGHGAISIQVAPNPIVAQPVTGDVYDFPFDVIMRETGGHPVTITRVTAEVTALGGIPVAQDSYDAAKINSLGYSTALPANGELRYHFAPRRSVARRLIRIIGHPPVAAPRPRPPLQSTPWRRYR